MATVTQFWSDPVLQDATVVNWTWDLGDRDFYWGFCVRPFQANNSAEMLRVVAAADNDLVHTTVMTVRVKGIGGPDVGLLRFTAIKVQT